MKQSQLGHTFYMTLCICRFSNILVFISGNGLDGILGRKHLLDHSPVTGNGLSITPSSTIRILGAHLDETMCFETHVRKIVTACFLIETT